MSGGDSRHIHEDVGTDTNQGSRRSPIQSLIETVSGDSFKAWYREREHARNIREGVPYFNGPASIKAPRRHSPSSLLQCKRKTAYKQLNAPEESRDPEGIFWIGSQFETEIAVPYLQDVVNKENLYVTNSVWVDFTVETDVGDLRIRGETDPVIVDVDANPLLLTEIKTKRSVESVDSPSKHHKAQAHAYLKGLSEKYSQDVTDALILYGSRTTLEVCAFHVEFDPAFWRDEVTDWAAEHSEYRLRKVLPPSNPEYNWECGFCSYRERCGKGESGYADIPERGFLPRVADYPREKVVEYLEATEGERLTPILATEYPQLAEEYDVCSWRCDGCTSTFSWDTVDVGASTPVCPACADEGKLAELSVENPVEAHSTDDGTTRLVSGGE